MQLVRVLLRIQMYKRPAPDPKTRKIFESPPRPRKWPRPRPRESPSCGNSLVFEKSNPLVWRLARLPQHTHFMCSFYPRVFPQTSALVFIKSTSGSIINAIILCFGKLWGLLVLFDFNLLKKNPTILECCAARRWLLADDDD